MSFKISLVAGLLLCFAHSLRAQAPPAATDLDLLLEPTNPIAVATAMLDTLTNPFDLLSASDTMIYSMIFNCPDTSAIDSVFAILGTTDGGSNLGTYAFEWDPTTPPAGTVYERNVATVRFCATDLLFNDPVYYEVYFKDSSGNASTVSKFNTLN